MERSSPLAAMQPPALPFGNWGCRGEAQSSYSEYNGGRLNLGPSTFNFKDLSMARSPTDYFSLKPVRGSSPTASLAADLSQNFHIDRRYDWQLQSTYQAIVLMTGSPQLPTPRRSLFSSNLFGTLSGRGMEAIVRTLSMKLILSRGDNNATYTIVLTGSRK